MEAKAVARPATLQWVLFFIALAAGAATATRGVLERAQRMTTADMHAEAFQTTRPGENVKAVLIVNQVSNGKLSGALLQRESDTLYRQLPVESASRVDAVLTPQTTVVMGKPKDIVIGAVVQVGGTLDENHAVRASQIVILTGYVRVEARK